MVVISEGACITVIVGVGVLENHIDSPSLNDFVAYASTFEGEVQQFPACSVLSVLINAIEIYFRNAV